MQTLHIEIAGRVQGVGFRWFVRERARELKLAGWVKNRPDGTVEIAAAGTDDSLRAFRAAVSQGPSGAVVKEVRDLAAEDVETLDNPFVIVR